MRARTRRSPSFLTLRVSGDVSILGHLMRDDLKLIKFITGLNTSNLTRLRRVLKLLLRPMPIQLNRTIRKQGIQSQCILRKYMIRFQPFKDEIISSRRDIASKLKFGLHLFNGNH